MLGYLAVIWGFVGIAFIFGNAIIRLGAIGLETFSHSLNLYHWLALDRKSVV